MLLETYLSMHSERTPCAGSSRRATPASSLLHYIEAQAFPWPSPASSQGVSNQPGNSLVLHPSLQPSFTTGQGSSNARLVLMLLLLAGGEQSGVVWGHGSARLPARRRWVPLPSPRPSPRLFCSGCYPPFWLRPRRGSPIPCCPSTPQPSPRAGSHLGLENFSADHHARPP